MATKKKPVAKKSSKPATKKTVFLLLVLLVLVVGCQLNKNPFLGTWESDLASLEPDPGDYWIIVFHDDNTFFEVGQKDSMDYILRRGYYGHNDTVLKLTYKGGLKMYISYAFYERNIMIWYHPIDITFKRW